VDAREIIEFLICECVSPVALCWLEAFIVLCRDRPRGSGGAVGVDARGNERVLLICASPRSLRRLQFIVLQAEICLGSFELWGATPKIFGSPLTCGESQLVLASKGLSLHPAQALHRKRMQEKFIEFLDPGRVLQPVLVVAFICLCAETPLLEALGWEGQEKSL
jgi:hypothetical protein